MEKKKEKSVSVGWVKPEFKKLDLLEKSAVALVNIEIDNLKQKLESIKNVLETIRNSKSSIQ